METVDGVIKLSPQIEALNLGVTVDRIKRVLSPEHYTPLSRVSKKLTYDCNSPALKDRPINWNDHQYEYFSKFEGGRECAGYYSHYSPDIPRVRLNPRRKLLIDSSIPDVTAKDNSSMQVKDIHKLEEKAKPCKETKNITVRGRGGKKKRGAQGTPRGQRQIPLFFSPLPGTSSMIASRKIEKKTSDE